MKQAQIQTLQGLELLSLFAIIAKEPQVDAKSLAKDLLLLHRDHNSKISNLQAQQWISILELKQNQPIA